VQLPPVVVPPLMLAGPQAPSSGATFMLKSELDWKLAAAPRLPPSASEAAPMPSPTTATIIAYSEAEAPPSSRKMLMIDRLAAVLPGSSPSRFTIGFLAPDSTESSLYRFTIGFFMAPSSLLKKTHSATRFCLPLTWHFERQG
jgi:hypothetical protein